MSTWLQTLISTPVIIAGLVGISAAVYAKRYSSIQPIEQAKEVNAALHSDTGTAKMAQAAASVMSPPSTELAPPKLDPISPSDLAQYDGSENGKPIYVAIKGRVFDVSPRGEMYRKGQGYNVFAGKDGSRGLGMSSLDPKDAVPDISTLDEAQLKTLNQWEAFFEKRYNIVGTVAKE
ncbi:cytochrome b5-like heme/steroid binding domain-containing protein [Naematelia encephala]|uniref:Cytochrome b5-like heme/steroid binding domain-containing protein n=1 Tax=Naematelia encephala TaxID=71784 RepID=A0A1Y2AN25_9TREE|nr:cytochrome b5-like heme/steroid binding domain-containing protein [Naematelia encephala]